MPSQSFLLYLDLTALQHLKQNLTEQYSSLSSSLCHTIFLSSFNEKSHGILFLKGGCFKYLASETAFCNNVRKMKELEAN